MITRAGILSNTCYRIRFTIYFNTCGNFNAGNSFTSWFYIGCFIRISGIFCSLIPCFGSRVIYPVFFLRLRIICYTRCSCSWSGGWALRRFWSSRMLGRQLDNLPYTETGSVTFSPFGVIPAILVVISPSFFSSHMA